MRERNDLCGGWLMAAANTELDRQYDDSVVNLPFIHKASDFTEIAFSNKFAVADRLQGETLYLEFRQVSGEAKIYCGDELLGEHRGASSGFRVKLADAVSSGQEFAVRAEVKPAARPDGNFIFGKVCVVSVGGSHFDLDYCGGPGVHLSTKTTEEGAELHIKARIANPNNYDVVSYAVENSAGQTVAARTEKPTGADTVIALPAPELWGGQKDAHLYTLKAALVRDTAVLDNLEIPFGVRTFEIGEDGFFRINGLKLPLNGVSLSDCGHLKTDKLLLEMLDANALASDSLPAKADLLYECDRTGTVFRFDLPYTGEDSDFEDLRDFLIQNRSHPSFAFVCCDERADEEYLSKFLAICKFCAPEVFTVLKRKITDPAPLPENLPNVVALTVGGGDTEDLMAICGRFEEWKTACPSVSFALFAEAPEREAAEEGKAPLSESGLCEWHEKLWNTFCKDKSLIGYFAGRLTDTKGETGGCGLVTYDRKYIKDAFWFYKAQFSASAFVKLCAAELTTVSAKKIDIRCYTNTPPVTLTVDGNEKNTYEAEALSDGVYVFRRVALKNKVSTVTVKAGDKTDTAQITFEKKDKEKKAQEKKEKKEKKVQEKQEEKQRKAAEAAAEETAVTAAEEPAEAAAEEPAEAAAEEPAEAAAEETAEAATEEAAEAAAEETAEAAAEETAEAATEEAAEAAAEETAEAAEEETAEAAAEETAEAAEEETPDKEEKQGDQGNQ